MTKTKTYAYICVYSAPWAYNNALHLRCANDVRLPKLRRSATTMEVIELPYLCTKREALAWFKQEFAEHTEYMQAYNFKHTSTKVKLSMDELRTRILNKQADVESVLAVLEE